MCVLCLHGGMFIGEVRYELIIINLMKINETLETEIDKDRGIER